MVSSQNPIARSLGDLQTALREFVRLEASSAVVLLVVTALALAVANSPLGGAYEAALAIKLGPSWIRLTALHWINDSLMAVFFMLVGLEIKREVVAGALSSFQQAALPLIAALGGVLAPAAIYVAISRGDADALAGWATPVATDIAFALGILALVGSRAPSSLKVFLTALAVLDDLLVVLIIVLFYAGEGSALFLLFAGIGLAVLIGLNRLGVTMLPIYLLIGAVVWFCVLRSGIHPTLAGVLVAFTVPMSGGDRHNTTASPLLRLEHALHPWVAWLVVPVFAFANAGVSFGEVTWATLTGPVCIGITAGLFLGKQFGILASAWLATRLGIARPPEEATFRHIHGVAAVCGVGFTMCLYIAALAFETEALQNAAKVGVLVGSLLSGLLGYVALSVAPRRTQMETR
jgi:NhaA family Na+:H+ antiporter